MEISRVYMQPVSRYAYRRDDCVNPMVTGFYRVENKGYDNMCYEVTFEDGFVDYIPLVDVERGNYKLYTK